MPNLISIAVETSKHYVALDSEGHVWRGQRVTKRGGRPVTWGWETAYAFKGKKD